MNERMDLDEYRRLSGLPPLPGAVDRQAKAQAAEAPKISKSKMRNKICVIDGIRFDSILEAAYYLVLESEVKAGRVSHYLRQVSMDCGAGVTYRLDFLVFYPGGFQVDYVDVKGTVTQVYKNKKKQVEHRYPVKIREVYRADIDASFIKTAMELNTLSHAAKTLEAQSAIIERATEEKRRLEELLEKQDGKANGV